MPLTTFAKTTSLCIGVLATALWQLIGRRICCLLSGCLESKCCFIPDDIKVIIYEEEHVCGDKPIKCDGY